MNNNQELAHYGILGMKWGRRRTDAQIAADNKTKKQKKQNKNKNKNKNKKIRKKLYSDIVNAILATDATVSAVKKYQSSIEKLDRLDVKGYQEDQILMKYYAEQGKKFYNSI